MGHQKAALEILTQLFTPQSIVQTSMGRTVLVWYMRYDIFVASMGSSEPGLPRHWTETLEKHCEAQLSTDPQNLEWVYERTENLLRIISRDMCSLVARRKTGEFSEDTFQAEHKKLSIRLRKWRDNLHPVLINPACLATAPIGQIKLFKYFSDYVPVYEPPLCFTTALICEWHSVSLMHLCQVTGDGLAEASTILGDMAQNSEAICEIIEVAQHCSTIPEGLLTMLHPSLSMAAIFLPRSLQHHAWLRKQFVLVESSG